MTKQIALSLIVAASLATSCGESGPDYNALYRMEKQYWNVDDYDNAIYKITSTAAGDKKPCYSVPETAPVFKKLVDIQNVAVVVEDEALGVKHRAEFAEGMFNHSRNMIDAYSVLDREDKFEYPQELVEVLTFHLYTQLHYFELGNQNILKEADDPNEDRIKNMISGNEQTLVNNFTLYLDFCDDEKAFTEDALQSYIDVLNEYFPALIEKYPTANYSGMKEKAADMLKKAQADNLKSSLSGIIAKIDANTTRIEEEKKAATDSTKVSQ